MGFSGEKNEFKSMIKLALLQMTNPENNVFPTSSLISACVWGQAKGGVCNLVARHLPSRLKAMLRKSLHSTVPPSHCCRTTSHCMLISEHLNTCTQTHIYSVSHSHREKMHKHKPSSRRTACWLKKLSCN